MKNCLAKILWAASMAAVASGPTALSAAENKQDVRVINTPTEAVPVALQGTATVTGGVQILNPPTAPVPVTGRFLAAVPASAFSKGAWAWPTVISGPDPVGTRYAITSVTVTNGDSTAALVSLEGGTTIPDSTDCMGWRGDGINAIRLRVPAGQTTHLAFPQPYVVTGPFDDSVFCLVVTGGGATDVQVMVAGYKF
jgi:hypothetical protein